ncbi:MAG: hypothetical protein IJH91_00245 [Mogibacterium sp.]|nr:hypothetical protein [Mogibacterium sp.]
MLFTKKSKVTLPPNASGRDVRLLLDFYTWKTREFINENHAANGLSTHEYSFPVRLDNHTYLFGTRYLWREAKAAGHVDFCDKFMRYCLDGDEYRKASDLSLDDKKLYRIGKVLRLMEKDHTLVETIRLREVEKKLSSD